MITKKITITDELDKALKAKAKEMGETQAAIIRAAIREYCK